MFHKVDSREAYIIIGTWSLIFFILLGINKGPDGRALEFSIGDFHMAIPGGGPGGEATNETGGSGGDVSCVDKDGDGYNAGGTTCGTLDFNDNDKFVFPGAPEWCDGKDNDLDGNIDYVNTPGDLCENKDCFGEICTFGLTWNALGNSADQQTMSNYDFVLTNAQNANRASLINARFVTHRTFVEHADYTTPYFGWDTVNQNESWFVHDDTGARSQNSSYPRLWLADISQTDYRLFRAELAGTIDTYDSGLDGWFYDNYVDFNRHGNYISANHDLNIYDIYTQSAFTDYMEEGLYIMKRAMGDKLIIANNHGESYIEYLDGYMAENWLHGYNADGWPAGWYPESKWLNDVALLANPEHQNKMLILQCNNPVDNPLVRRFCLASYLIGKQQGVDTYIGFGHGTYAPQYYDDFDVDLGAPLANYTEIQDGLYMREFENGKVYVNPTQSTTFSNIDLGGTYENLDGQEVSTISLAGHRVAILTLISEDPPGPVCGNGIRETGEQCDGDDLNGLTCEIWGFDGGTLSCTSQCIYYTLDCFTNEPAVCGNGTIETGEQCDGSQLAGQSCTSLGYDNGSLICSNDCQFDTSSCSVESSGGAGSGGDSGGDTGGDAGAGGLGDLGGTGDDDPQDNTNTNPDIGGTPHPDRGRLIARSGVQGAAVYRIGRDGKKYVFPDSKTYFTWYDDFDDVEKVSLSVLDQYEDGGSVPYRAGTELITHRDTAKVYAVSSNGTVHWIKDEATAIRLFGNRWYTRVQDVIPGFFVTSYTLGSDLDQNSPHPNGTLLQQSLNIYLIENGEKRRFNSIEAFFANGYNTNHVIVVDDLSDYPNGSDITAFEEGLLLSS